MVSLSDFFDLADRLKNAQSEDDKRQHREALRGLIEADIRDLFADPAFPRRRRSFGAIRAKLGIIDNSSDHRSDAALRETLYLMGARVHKGEGDDALWHLPQNATPPPGPDGTTPGTGPGTGRKPRSAWTLLYAALLGLAALAAVLSYLGVTPRDIIGGLWPGETRESCIKNANGIMLEIIKCNEKFGP